MPNPEQRKSEYSKYDNLLKQSIKGNKSVGNSVRNLKNLRANLKQLNAEIEKCYKQDENGQYLPIDEKSLKQITKLYKLCDHNISLVENDLKKGGMQGTLIEQLHKVLKRDEACVSHLKPGDVFPEKFRRNIVTTDAIKDIKSLGGALSKRYPITYTDENGKKVYGFFTETSTVMTDPKNPEDRSAVNLYNNVGGIAKGSNLTDRNCAMTRIANLLGVNDLLAESHSMTVIDASDKEAKPKNGIFMETSKGVPFSKLDDQEDVLDGFDAAYGDGRFKRSISDMQILDYICGNVDRHMQNITYIFDDTNALVGIQGIDNDFSMGNIVPEGKTSWLPALNQMRAISQSMAEKVKSMQQADLEYVLKGLSLSTEEINSAWNRVKKVKELIKNAKVYDGSEEIGSENTMIVPDDRWSEINYDKLCSSKRDKFVLSDEANNLYDVVKGAHQDITPFAKAKAQMKKIKENLNKIKEAQRKAAEENLNPDDLIIGEDNNDIKNGKVDVELINENDDDDFEITTYDNDGNAVHDNKNVNFDEIIKVIPKENGNPRENSMPDEPKFEDVNGLKYAKATLTNLAYTPEALNASQDKIKAFIDRMNNAAKNEKTGKNELEKRSDEYKNVYAAAEKINEWYDNFKSNGDKTGLNEVLNTAAEYCQKYIDKRDPWSKIGKTRQKIVTDMMEFIGTQGIMINEYHEYVDKAVTQKINANMKAGQLNKGVDKAREMKYIEKREASKGAAMN